MAPFLSVPKYTDSPWHRAMALDPKTFKSRGDDGKSSVCIFSPHISMYVVAGISFSSGASGKHFRSVAYIQAVRLNDLTSSSESAVQTRIGKHESQPKQWRYAIRFTRRESSRSTRSPE
jgi:hypothetical protein